MKKLINIAFFPGRFILHSVLHGAAIYNAYFRRVVDADNNSCERYYERLADNFNDLRDVNIDEEWNLVMGLSITFWVLVILPFMLMLIF